MDLRPEVQIAHSEGTTLLSISSDASKVFSAGSDQLIKSFDWDGTSLSEPEIIEGLNSTITALIAIDNHLLWVGCQDGTVHQVFLNNNNKVVSLPTASQFSAIRFFAKPRPGAVGRERVAVGSILGLEIMIFDLEGNTGIRLVGLDEPPITIQFHPNGTSLLCLSRSGKLFSWDLLINDIVEEVNPSKQLAITRSFSADFTQSLVEIAMEGNQLIVPGHQNGEFLVLDMSTWLVKSRFNTHQSQLINQCTLDKTSNLLAVAGEDKLITIYNREDYSILVSIDLEVEYIDEGTKITGMDWLFNRLVITSNQGSLIIYGEDERNELEHSFDQLNITGNNREFENNEVYEGEKVTDREDFLMKISLSRPVPLQTGFSPGSTQMEFSDRQLLAHNMIGGILHHISMNGKPTYSVRFLPNGSSPNRFKDYQFGTLLHYTKGSISAHGILLANSTSILYRPHHTNLVWEAQMPEDELINTICAIDNSIVISSNLGYLRFYNLFGLQLQIIQAPSLHSLSLASNKNQLLHVYHLSGEPNNLRQRLGYTMYDVDDVAQASELDSGLLNLSPGAAMEWIGLTSDSNLPCCVDSEGLIQFLPALGQPWRPIATVTLGQFFTLGVDRNKIYGMRVSPDPSWIDPPYSIRSLPWRPPILATNSNSPDTELDLMLHLIDPIPDQPQSKLKYELVQDKMILAMISSAFQHGREYRAVELANLLCRIESLNFALKLAKNTESDESIQKIKALIQLKLKPEIDDIHDINLTDDESEEEREMIRMKPSRRSSPTRNLISTPSKKIRSSNFQQPPSQFEENVVISNPFRTPRRAKLAPTGTTTATTQPQHPYQPKKHVAIPRKISSSFDAPVRQTKKLFVGAHFGSQKENDKLCVVSDDSD